MAGIQALEAVLILTKHLIDLLPFLMALEALPSQSFERIGLIQSTARKIADTQELASDWYKALELLTDQDLSTKSVADLIILSIETFNNGQIGPIWQACYKIGLIDEQTMGQWLMLEQLTEGD